MRVGEEAEAEEEREHKAHKRADELSREVREEVEAADRLPELDKFRTCKRRRKAEPEGEACEYVWQDVDELKDARNENSER